MSVLLGSVGGESGRALAERERVASSPSQPPMAISLITVPCLAVWSSACLQHGMSRSVHKILHVSPSTTCLVCLCVPRLR